MDSKKIVELRKKFSISGLNLIRMLVDEKNWHILPMLLKVRETKAALDELEDCLLEEKEKLKN